MPVAYSPDVKIGIPLDGVIEPVQDPGTVIPPHLRKNPGARFPKCRRRKDAEEMHPPI